MRWLFGCMLVGCLVLSACSFVSEVDSSGNTLAGVTSGDPAGPDDSTTSEPETTESPTPMTEQVSESLEVALLEVGDCFDDEDEIELDETSQIFTVSAVDCANPHDNEVYDTLRAKGDVFPGQTQMSDQAETDCIAQFDAFVGLAYLDSEYEVGTIFPTSQSWALNGDRKITCFVFRVDLEKITGSVEGVAR